MAGDSRGRPSRHVSIEKRLHRWLAAVNWCAPLADTTQESHSGLTIVSKGLFVELLSYYAVMVAIFCFGIWLFLWGCTCQNVFQSTIIHVLFVEIASSWLVPSIWGNICFCSGMTWCMVGKIQL